ncbi:hypothetical protein FACS1894192_07920 [Bacilli bacterium]|nr:hypothetical protein FACS1894192_07920 [Bacilli bacterium]
MIKKFTMLIVSILFCSQISLLSVSADTASTFILESSGQVKNSDTPRQSQPSGEPLPTTGTKKGALPVTGEQAACIASIVGAVILTSCLIIWQKKRAKEKEENDGNYKQ